MSEDLIVKVEAHNEAIHGNILPRLQQVEETQKLFTMQLSELQSNMQKVQTGQANLELTVMKDGQATRDLLNKFVDHFFTKDKQEAQIEERITIAKLSTKEKIIVGIFGAIGAGGGIIGIIEAFFK